MRFGGIHKFSLCDYPGKTAAVLFTQGCNFRCPFCHNSTLLALEKQENRLREKDILAFLEKRSGLLDGVVISGGEPTLQQGLADFCRLVRELGFQVKLDTNGSRPEVLKQLLAGKLVNFIAMDIKATLERYHVLTGVAVDTTLITRSMSIISNAEIPALFRTTWVNGLHRKEERDLIPAMLPKNISHIFQPFQPEHALQPELCAQKTATA